MDNVIGKLRTESKFYTKILITTVICLILSVLVMAFSSILSQVLVALFFTISIYLFYFLGVDPYYKGIFYAVLPILITLLLLEVFVRLPIPETWTWFFEGNSSGRGGVTEAIFVFSLFIVLKITGIKPFKHNGEE